MGLTLAVENFEKAPLREGGRCKAKPKIVESYKSISKVSLVKNTILEKFQEILDS